MDELEFVKPTQAHKGSAEEFKQEFFDYKESVINGSALLDQMEYGDWLENAERNSNPKTVRADWVVENVFFAVRKSNCKIVGIIVVRQNIENEFLSKYGGHIGYAVRPSERQKGYATQMLKLALTYAKSIGLSKVMLGCYSDNLASIKTIEKCGGVITENKPYLDEKPMRVYWIEI